VLSREGVVRPLVAVPSAVAMPLLSAAGRLYMERHWLSDAAGGLLAGVSLGAIVAAAYETTAG
jgi:membrane-associated phospholipid phosphatase